MVMENIITYIIVGLFALFFIYFIYTIIDTLFLSKKNRRVHSASVNKQREIVQEKENNTITPESRDELTTDETDTEESKKESKNDSSNTSSVQSDDATTEKNEPVVDTARKIIKEKKPGLFQRFKTTITMHKEQKEKEEKQKKEERAAFEPGKIDNRYNEILEQFVKKQNGSWKQQDFYELLLMLTTKGYDKKPSEIQQELDTIKKTLSNEQKEVKKAQISDGSSSEVGETDSELSEEEQREAEQKKDAQEDKEVEKELVQMKKDHKEHKDTREELSKTLEEIRAIRERLSKKN